MWHLKGYSEVTNAKIRPLLSGFAYRIYTDWCDYVIWQHKETGLYALSLGYMITRKILGEEMTLEQLEFKLCHECPFYGESGEEEGNEPCRMEEYSG